MIKKLRTNGLYDGVHCNYCDTDMLIPIGGEKCPKCSKVGMMGWLEINNQELSKNEALKKFPNIKIFDECEDVTI